MLPEFLFTAGNSMQEVARDDFNLLNGASVTCDKDMCLAVQRLNNTSPLAASSLNQQHIPPNSIEHDPNHFDTHHRSTPATPSPLNGIKLEDHNSPVDLFPTHPATWQQHPMNSHEHAHHRLATQHSTPQTISHQNYHQQQQQHHHQRFGKLLLQGSDDPLICHGANSVGNDDDQPLIAAATVEQQPMKGMSSIGPQQQQLVMQKRPQNGCSTLTKQQLKVKAGLMSAQQQQQQSVNPPPPQQQPQQQQTATVASKQRVPRPAKKKGVLKLRFHHQALPPEYLSHYEAAQAQQAQRAKESTTQPVKVSHTAKLPPPKSAHENVRSWLQKIAEIQRTAQQQKQGDPEPQQSTANSAGQVQKLPHDANNNHQQCRMQPQKTPSPSGMSAQPSVIVHAPKTQQPPPLEGLAPGAVKVKLPHVHKRVVNYADLPYMGEITLDNSKPRRGRKPKKADICHLIYKNYGTIFPGTPKGMLSTAATGTVANGNPIKLKTLEGQLQIEEPLNLCLRDQSSDLYSISSGDDDDTPGSERSCCTTPTAAHPISALDAATDTLLAANMKTSMPCVLSCHENKESPSPSARAACLSAQNATDLLLHPVSVYYQKLIESGTLSPQSVQPFGLPIETIEKDNQLALKIPIPSGLFITPKQEKVSPVPSGSHTLEYPEPMSTPSSIKSEQSQLTNATSTSASTATGHAQAPQKRKRSAIFIPPIPAENTSNPATEVSICKFKFTGGAKPTLQEKKMLSVDSDGNYRYYSGTGDKSARGYEFFPRESLQQSAGLLPGVNCTGAFLNATGEKMTHDIPPPSAGLSNELLQIPESPTGTLLMPSSSVGPEPSSPIPLTSYGASNKLSGTRGTQANTHSKPLWHTTVNEATNSGDLSPQASPAMSRQVALERKKKSRRSAQREKLEKTFKEKGFLIQTQQLESAEGATYCKFRQLKKFTRYLFRNWKDYLPDDLQQANAAAAAAAAAAAVALNKRGGEGDEMVSAQQQQSAIESILARHGLVGGNNTMRTLKEGGGAIETPSLVEHSG